MDKLDKLLQEVQEVKVSYKKLRGNAIIPFAATKLSGGWDVTASDIEQVESDLVVVRLGLAMQPTEGYRLMFSPRSSFTKHNWVLQNSPALGDADYLGEYMLKFRALPIGGSVYGGSFKYEEFPYAVGDRCAQMYLEKIIYPNFVEVEEFENHTDRVGGFGSTNI
jgi:dUTPase